MAFYKKHDDTTLLEAPNFVLNKNFELYANTHEQYEYPVDGWYWFDTREQALTELGVVEDI